MGQIKWTEKSSQHLQAIYEYIAKDSPTYATRFIKALISATSKLQTLPHCGRMVPELEASGLREVLYQNYRIVYRTTPGEDNVEILAVIHGARELTKALKVEWIL